MTKIRPSVVSIQVGLPRALGVENAADTFDRPWTSGIFKSPIEGLVLVGSLGLTGDGQADPTVHGGADKAVCAYAAAHYPDWRQTPGLEAIDAGAFGENFTIGGLTEEDVCIGDIWRAGEVVVQVSQPRQPCWKLARKWRIADLAEQVVRSGRTGWYFRVLEEGYIERGTPLVRIARLHPEWRVNDANRVMHDRPHDLDGAARLASVATLSTSWKTTLASRLRGAQ